MELKSLKLYILIKGKEIGNINPKIKEIHEEILDV